MLWHVILIMIVFVGNCFSLWHHKPLVIWWHWTMDQRDWWSM